MGCLYVPGAKIVKACYEIFHGTADSVLRPRSRERHAEGTGRLTYNERSAGSLACTMRESPDEMAKAAIDSIKSDAEVGANLIDQKDFLGDTLPGAVKAGAALEMPWAGTALPPSNSGEGLLLDRRQAAELSDLHLMGNAADQEILRQCFGRRGSVKLDPTLDKICARERTEVDIDDVLPNERQPRLGPKEDEELQRQIEANEGLFEPLLVEPHPDLTDKIRIIDGDRRWTNSVVLVNHGREQYRHPAPH